MEDEKEANIETVWLTTRGQTASKHCWLVIKFTHAKKHVVSLGNDIKWFSNE
ncbi:MAG: hypothetical protein ACI86H_000747 [bacterium]